MFFPYGWLWPELVFLGPQEGLVYVAERLLPFVQNMTEVFENPFNDTLRLHYERMTSSSEGFDQEMKKMVDFLFKGLISPEQRAKVGVANM